MSRLCHEFLLAVSCKRRRFALPVIRTGSLNSGNGFDQNVRINSDLRTRHFVVQYRLQFCRRYFLFDGRLLLELSRCIWETLKIYCQSCLTGKNSVPGATIALQTFGDLLGFNPHGRVLVTDGCFSEKAYLWVRCLGKGSTGSGHDTFLNIQRDNFAVT